MKKLLITVIILAALWASSAVLAVDTSFDVEGLHQRFEKNIRHYTLDNGLRVILMKNGVSPSLALYLKVGVGSANEPFDRPGTAHFLEHLLFKGTNRLGTLNYKKEKLYLDQLNVDGERLDTIERQLLDPLLTPNEREKLNQDKIKYSRRLELWQQGASKFTVSEEDSKIYSLAGQVGYNAYTSTDVTNYQIKLPAQRLELWAALESERFLHPVFREFYPERKVILEERRMRYDTKPSSLLYELFIKTAFGFSPYGKPVIGFESNILRLKYSQTKEFFEKNYIPPRMVIAIVGDLEFEPTIAVVKKYFERLPKKPLPEFPAISLGKQNGQQMAWLEVKHTPQFITGYRRPPVTHKDNAALEVLARILTDGQTSRLQKRLVIDEKKASSVSAYTSLPGEKLDSMFTIFCGVYQEEDYEPVQKAIRDELKKIADTGVSDNELAKVKNNYLAELVSSLKANAGMADNLSYYELMTGSYKNFFKSLDAISAVNNNDLKRVVQTYFQDKFNTTVFIKNPVE